MGTHSQNNSFITDSFPLLTLCLGIICSLETGDKGKDLILHVRGQNWASLRPLISIHFTAIKRYCNLYTKLLLHVYLGSARLVVLESGCIYNIRNLVNF